MLTREIVDNKILIQRGGAEVLLDEDTLLRDLGVDSVIRIPIDEYKDIDPTLGYFMHFNLQDSDGTLNKTYILAKIIRSGYYKGNTNEQVLPLLDMDNCYKAKCIEIKNNLNYDDIDPSLFTYSMSNIKNVDELKSAILTRYGKSLPNIAKEDILSAGIGYRLLQFI